MRKTFLLIGLLILVGCSKNPLGALPPVQNQAPTFEEHLQRLKTPGYTYFWLKNFAQYDIKGQLGWDWVEKGMPDLAYSLAHSVWESYINGHNVGVCGQFAATYIVAAREQGYDCGFLIMYMGGSGHAQGWIIEENGTVTITDNHSLHRESYSSKEVFFAEIAQRWFRQSNKQGFICNSKLERLYDQDGWHGSERSMWSIAQKSIVVKCLGYSN